MINIKTFLVVDGHSLAHRGFHALNVKLSAPDGTPTAMIVGFMNMLYRVQDELLPDCTVIVFDAPGKTFRHELQKDYKADRKPLADELRIQLPILQELLRLCGHNVIIREGVEADDTAASIARLAQNEGHEAVILSSDKDLFQVLGENIRIMRPLKNGVAGAEIYDVHAFVREFGFMPSSMADYLAIIGDKADNVKGIAGIGEKGAQKILAEYPTLEDIFASLDKFTKSTRTKLQACGLEAAKWTRDNIIRLHDDIFSGDSAFLNDCMNFTPDFEGAENLALRLGLSRVLKRMGSTKEISPRAFVSSRAFMMPECETITDDYKSTLRKNPGLTHDVWDLKTAYYLLHPDETGANFPDVMKTIRTSEDPARTLADFAGNINAEILTYDGLHDIMTKIDLPLIPVLNKMEDNGVRIDREKFLSVQSELEEKILQLEAELIRKTGRHININSSQQVSWLLFEYLGFEPGNKTKGKTSYSTDAATLEKLAKLPGGEIPALILEHRELSKMLTGFVVPLQKAAGDDGIIHTTFEPAFTGTGRLSSRDPNLQNIPAFGHWAEEIKKGLIPVNPENVFVAADYSQIELRVLAHLSGEERLIDAFTHNRDIHTETASWVFGVMPELVTPELRRAAKMINFGLLYGMSSFGLAERLNISRQEAKDIMTRYFDALPGLQEYLDDTVKQAKARGYARTLEGRIRPVKEIPAKNQALDRALINTPIQGTAADIARRALVNFMNAGRGELFLQVHDSLVCECHVSEADDVADMLGEIMRASGGEVKHLEVEIKRGRSLADV